MELEQDAPHRSHMVHAGCDLMSESGPAVQSAGIPIGASSDEPRGAGSDRSSYVASGGHLAAECAQLHRNAQSRAGDESRNRGWGREGSDALATRRGESRNPRRSIGGGLVKGAAVLMGVVSMGMVGGVRGCSSTLSLMPGSASSPAYANMFEVWDDPTAPRTSSSPVTFRVQCHTEMGWEVAVTGGCQALGYWSAEKALLLRTDPGRYPLWEGVGQLPGGCDIEYKYLMRRREHPGHAHWEQCPNRQVRTVVTEKAVLLVTDPESMTQEELTRQEMVTSNYFQEYTTLSAPFSSTLVFNTARPQEDFKEMLEDKAFQRPCALVFCRDSGTEIFVRDYEAPHIQGLEEDEPLLETRPDDRREGEERLTDYADEDAWRDAPEPDNTWRGDNQEVWRDDADQDAWGIDTTDVNSLD